MINELYFILKKIIKLIYFFFKTNKIINKKKSNFFLKKYYRSNSKKEIRWQYLLQGFRNNPSNSKIKKEILKKLNKNNFFEHRTRFFEKSLIYNFFDLKLLFNYINEIKTKFTLKKNVKLNYYKYNLKVNDKIIIKKSVNWLLECKKNSLDNGICVLFDLNINKLTSSFPETSGYIIPTLVECYKIIKKQILIKEAKEISDWILDIIQEDGGLGEPYGFFSLNPRIFTTAQAILGLLSIYEIFKEKKYINGAIKMGNFLLNNLNKDGSWNTKYLFLKKNTAYKSRVSWILFLLYKKTNDHRYKYGCIRSINFIIEKLNINNVPKFCSFKNDDSLLTHLLGYHLVALINFSFQKKLLGKKKIKKILSITDYFYKLLKCHIDKYGIIKGELNLSGKKTVNYSCLTGNFQLLYFAILYEKRRNIKKNKLSDKIYQFAKKYQVKSKNKLIDGAIAGSYPINGDYCSNMLPSWASKFFIDSLLLKNNFIKNYNYIG